jgi:hypothetical protein
MRKSCFQDFEILVKDLSIPLQDEAFYAGTSPANYLK